MMEVTVPALAIVQRAAIAIVTDPVIQMPGVTAIKDDKPASNVIGSRVTRTR
jgi:hypothetical protein